jgi:hypothetical protein
MIKKEYSASKFPDTYGDYSKIFEIMEERYHHQYSVWKNIMTDIFDMCFFKRNKNQIIAIHHSTRDGYLWQMSVIDIYGPLSHKNIKDTEELLHELSNEYLCNCSFIVYLCERKDLMRSVDYYDILIRE